MKIMWIDQDKWDDVMYHQKCVCGHELYLHAFTLGEYDEYSVSIKVSQCTFCDYDKENEKFFCEEFIRQNE